MENKHESDIECLYDDIKKTDIKTLAAKNKIELVRNPNGDTRTASNDVTYEQFSEANISHIRDVTCVMSRLSGCMLHAGLLHDYTKLDYQDKFYNDFKRTLNTGDDFTEMEWYKLHIEKERHHLLSNCPEDVNLIDVIEMIVDCSCAGLTRRGEIYDIKIPDEILHKAIDNTVELIKDITIVVEGEQK